MDEYGVLNHDCQLISSFLLYTLEKSFKAYWVTFHNNAFPLTQESIVALINNSKPPSPWQQIKNNLIPSLELNPFLLAGSWGPCTPTNPHLNHQMEVVTSSSWNFRDMDESIKVSEQY